MDQLQETSDDVSKLTIAREIALNSDFKLQAASFSPKSLEDRVEETLHKAFWDSLEEQLSACPPDYAQAIQLLQEGDFPGVGPDENGYAEFYHPEPLHLQDHTIQYKPKKFQELLDKLPNSLDRTREWLCKAAAEMYEETFEDISERVLQEVGRTPSQLGYAAFTADKCASLKGQIKSIADEGNAVRHVIDFPKGLDPLQEELLEVGRRFGSVIHHNRRVFGPYCSGVLQQVLLPDTEPDAAAGPDSF